MKRRGSWRFLLVAVAAAGLVAGCGDQQQATTVRTDAAISTGDLGSCGSQPRFPRFRCGSIQVPLERADPSLGQTRIGFAVRPPDRRPSHPSGAIFAVEGGPGYSSTGTAWSYKKLFGSLLRRQELVLVDMRGTGRSKPLGCRALQSGTSPQWIGMSRCARKLGPTFDSYRTSAAADDINSVRSALGFEKIALYGDSYGTYLAQSYAFRHPDTLAAVVFDSAYPAKGESPWYPSIIKTGVESMSIACRNSPDCSGNAGRRLDRLTAFLRQRHRDVGALVNSMGGAGYGPPATYVQIDSAGVALRHGDHQPWRRLTAAGVVGYGHPRSYSGADEAVVSCNDYPMLWDKSAGQVRRRVELQKAVRDYKNRDALRPFTPQDVALSSDTLYNYCLTAPKPGPNYEPPISPGEQPTTAPALVVSGQLDDVTTPYEGRLVRREFPHAHQYIAPGAGHVASLYDTRSPAAVHIRRFLRRVLNG